jgi:hypothetical protein
MEYLQIGSENIFNTGYTPKETDMEYSFFAIRYNSDTPSGVPIVEFWSNNNTKAPTTISDTNLDFKELSGKLKFGCNPASDSECFDGYIKYFVIMDSWLDDDLMKPLLTKGPPPLPGKSSSTGVYTTDSRTCISMCDDSSLPDTGVSEPAMDDEEKSKGETNEEEKKKTKEEEKEEQTPAVDGGSAEATCSLTLVSEQFVNVKTGTKERIACPPGCIV